MSLVNYSSSSSDSDNIELEDYPEPFAKKRREDASKYEHKTRPKLPSALAILGSSRLAKDDLIDDPAQHEGRVRTFKHERGNWVTYVYVAVEANLFEDVQQFCQNELSSVVDMRLPNDELHISLSKTVILQYHLIDSFVQALGSAFSNCDSFSLSMSQLKVYTNAEKTRTFMALTVDELHHEQVHSLMLRVDEVMLAYRQPVFYDPPSFHMSFLWCLGDQVELLNQHLPALTNKLLKQNDQSGFNVHVKRINWFSGNKNFSFKLRK